MSLPFSLALSTPGGWSSQTLATFAEVADLWLFWTAWTETVPDNVRAAARFTHTGRSVQHVRPQDWTGEQAFKWAADRRAA
jgi:hypothetical protein